MIWKWRKNPYNNFNYEQIVQTNFGCYFECGICLYLPPDGIWHKVNDPKVGLKWGLGKVGSNLGSNPAGLCWSSAHLVQCEADEPSWTWTQTWVPAWMLDYRLNWTKRSSAILAGKWLSTEVGPAKRPRSVICRCLPSDRTWHKVKSPKAD